MSHEFLVLTVTDIMIVRTSIARYMTVAQKRTITVISILHTMDPIFFSTLTRCKHCLELLFETNNKSQTDKIEKLTISGTKVVLALYRT